MSVSYAPDDAFEARAISIIERAANICKFPTDAGLPKIRLLGDVLDGGVISFVVCDCSAERGWGKLLFNNKLNKLCLCYYLIWQFYA